MSKVPLEIFWVISISKETRGDSNNLTNGITYIINLQWFLQIYTSNSTIAYKKYTELYRGFMVPNKIYKKIYSRKNNLVWKGNYNI